MDQALSLLSSIYDVYKTIKDGQDQFQATYGRMKDLMTQFQSMQDTDTLVQSRLLDKYIVIARDFLKYLDKYKKRKFVSKVFHQSEMLAEIEGFNQELEALFQLYHLAMGSHIVEHNRTQEATMDELVRGMRVLLQGSTGGHALKTEQSSDDLVSAAAQQSSGPVAKAQTDGDVATLLGLLVDGADAKQAELAAQALFELAEEEAMRDTIVQASAVPAFIGLLRDAGHKSTKIRVFSAKTLRRLAVRDVHEVTIVEAGGINALSAVLLSPASGDDELTTAVAAALANLVFQAEHKIILLKTPRVLDKLVELVRSGSSSQKKHAANTLRELAANDDCASAINDAGGITALVDMLHIGTPELCASALSALWNLSSLEKNRTEIAAVGGVNAIVAQIRRGATDDQRQLAASALAVLAQDDANDSLIGAAGGVELLVTLLQTGTDGQKNSAAWALAELANHKDNATAMLRAGVAPALMAAFRSGSDIQRAKAGLALEYIAELVEDISSLADEIGVSSVVSLLRGTADQRQHAASIVASMAQHEAYQTKLGELGAIELLVDLVKKSPLKTAGVKALGALASENETNQEKIGDVGGIDAVVSVLSKMKFGGDAFEDGEVDAFEALEEMLQTSVLRQVAIDAGAVPDLLRALASGNIDQKRQSASLLSDLVQELPDDDDCESFLACVEGLAALITSHEVDTDEVLLANVLSALMGVTVRENGSVIFVDKAQGISILAELLSRVNTEAVRTDVGFVYANIAVYEQNRMTLADVGALELFNSSLNSKNDEVQIMAAYGLSQLSGSKEICQRMMDTRGLCRRIVKLLHTAATDDAKERLSEALCNLSSHPEFAVELAQMHGLEELITFAEDGTDTQTHNALTTLANLSAVPENVEVLTEIGAVEAAAVASVAASGQDIEEGDQDVREYCLQLWSNMSSNREAAQRMADNGVVTECVEALQSEDSDRKQNALTTLANLLKLETGEDESKSDKDDDDTDSDKDDDDDDDDDDEEDEDESNDEEEDDNSVLTQIRDADGIDPLMELLEDPGSPNHVAIIKLLDALASDDEASKRKIGGCLAVLIETLREGSEEEQDASASAIVTLVEDSKRNAATAIRARVADAFMKLLSTDIAADSIKTSFEGLLSAFKSIKSTESIAAVKKVTTSLVKLAVDDDGKRGENAAAVLEELLDSSSLVKTVLEAGAPTTFAAVITQALDEEKKACTPQVKRAGSILAQIANGKYATKLFSLGVIDDLLRVFKSAPGEVRTVIAEVFDEAGRNVPDQRDMLVKYADVLLDMLRHGAAEERAAGAGAIAAITFGTGSVFEKMPQTELLESCLPLLNADDVASQLSGLRLVASLASFEDFGEQVVHNKEILRRTMDFLLDDSFENVYAVYTVLEIALHAEGRAFLIDAGVEKRLNQLQQKHSDDDGMVSPCADVLDRLAGTAP